MCRNLKLWAFVLETHNLLIWKKKSMQTKDIRLLSLMSMMHTVTAADSVYDVFTYTCESFAQNKYKLNQNGKDYIANLFSFLLEHYVNPGRKGSDSESVKVKDMLSAKTAEKSPANADRKLANPYSISPSKLSKQSVSCVCSIVDSYCDNL